MPLNYDALMAFEPIVLTHEYTARDTMLYALGVGIGAEDACDPAALRFVYEDGLQALPTMAVVLAYPGSWIADPKYNATYNKLLHGEQFLTVHKPLRAAGTVIGTTRVEAVYDKGASKGAVVYHAREIRDAADDSLLISLKSSSFLRADGGFDGPTEGAPKPHPIPDRAADQTIALPTRIDQALLYRLSGDYNPLHADPEVARAAGFDRPILHGLCTYGVIGRSVVAALCGGDATRLKTYNVRFSSPVMPGETLDVEIWREADGRAALRASVDGKIVVNNGLVEFE